MEGERRELFQENKDYFRGLNLFSNYVFIDCI